MPLWLSADLVEAARAAFLFDFNADPTNGPVTLGRWVGRAVDEFNSLTVDERADQGCTPNTRGSFRSFYMSVAAVEAMHHAIAAEVESRGRMVAVSQYVAAAVHRAAESARHRAGGSLPAPPAVSRICAQWFVGIERLKPSDKRSVNVAIGGNSGAGHRRTAAQRRLDQPQH